MKKPINFILTASLLLSLSGCYRLPDGPPVAQSQLPVPSVSQPEALPTNTLTLAWYPQAAVNPILSQDRVNSTLASLLYEPLFRLDARFVPQPALCQSSSVSENGLVWTLTLKAGVTFSDGSPLTAAVAARSLEQARTTPRWSARLADVVSVSAGAGLTLTISLSRPNRALPALLDVPIVSDSGDRPLGTGLYVLDGSNDRLIPRVHRQDLPYEIRLLPITRHTDLTQGFGPEGGLSLADADLNATDHPGFAHLCADIPYDTTTLVYLGFNAARGSVRSAEARRAISQVLDRGSLVRSAFGGHALAASLPIHPASPLYDESLARQLSSAGSPSELLDQAGLADKALTLLVNRENSARLAAAQQIARQLEKAGMTVRVSAQDWSGYLNALTNGQFDLYLAETTLRADFDLSPLVGSGGSLNYTRWSSGTADRLMAALRNASEEDAPQAARDLCTELSDKCPVAPLCFKRGSILVRSGLDLPLTPTRADPFFGWF